MEMPRGPNSPPPVVFVHIGCPKSGTSHIQARLSANNDEAARQGLLWPKPWERQVRAVRDLRSLGVDDQLKPTGAWNNLCREISVWEGGAALVSMEWLVTLRPYQIKACIEALEPARVEIVCSARDLVRTLPAHWQESTQNNKHWAWDEFVAAVTSDDDVRHPAKAEFWNQQNVPKILQRWNAVVPMDRVHLVTIPPAGADPDVLWQRFASVLPIDGSRFHPPDRQNSSLGVVSASLMRRVNEEARIRGVPKAMYARYIKQILGKQVLAQQSETEAPIAVPPDVEAWLRRRAEAMVRELDDMPVHVVGSLDDLIPRPSPSGGRAPSSVDDHELLAAAVSALVGVLEVIASRDSGQGPLEDTDSRQ